MVHCRACSEVPLQDMRLVVLFFFSHQLCWHLLAAHCPKMSPFFLRCNRAKVRQLTSLARRFFCASCLLLFCMSTCLLSSSADGKFPFIYPFIHSVSHLLPLHFLGLCFFRFSIWLESCSYATRSFLLLALPMAPFISPFFVATVPMRSRKKRRNEEWASSDVRNILPIDTVVCLFVVQINFHNDSVFIARLVSSTATCQPSTCHRHRGFTQWWMTSVHSSVSNLLPLLPLLSPLLLVSIAQVSSVNYLAPAHCQLAVQLIRI